MKRLFIITVVLSFLGNFQIAKAEGLEAKPYGFFLPKYILASAGLITFTANQQQQNEVAPSAAAIGKSGTNSHPRSTWQLGQSRFGVIFGYGPQLSGTLEVDFLNNVSAASSSFALLAPRLRLAKIDYRMSSALALTFGLDWDIFNGGVGSYSYNTVGNYYQSGNVGFLRQQFIVKMGKTQGWNFSFALGLPQKNDQTSSSPGNDGPQELTLLPSVAANLTYKADSTNLYGISAIAGRVLFTSAFSDAHSASGISFFTLKDFGFVALRAKAYYGKNLSNLNALTLSSGGVIGGQSYDIFEYGGFFTLNAPVSEAMGIFAGAGYGSLFDMKSIPAGVGTTPLSGNLKMTLGTDFKLKQNLIAYIELSSFRSRYNEGSADNVNIYTANMIDLGMKLNI